MGIEGAQNHLFCRTSIEASYTDADWGEDTFWLKYFESQLFAANVNTIRSDNQSAICVARNQGYNPRTKHLDIRYHFVKDALNHGAIEVNNISTNEQPADGLTKALMKHKLQAFKQSLGIED